VADTGGGAQLVTVVDPSRVSVTGTFTAWAKRSNGCWSPAMRIRLRDLRRPVEQQLRAVAL
jgi:hypothetical protein